MREYRHQFNRLIAAFTLIVISGLLAIGQPIVVAAEVWADNGMVAAAHPLASQIGVDILQAGGNAVDAAVATAFAIGILEPHASGIGGCGVGVIYLADEDRSISVDFRAGAPRLAAELVAAGRLQSMPSVGWRAAAVPGLVAGLSTMLEQFGTMSLAEVLAPSIALAEEGFPLGPSVAQQIEDQYDVILSDPGLADIYLDEYLLPPFAGDIIKNPGYAKSLRMIAEGGPDVFYKGELADAIVEASQAGGGFLTKEDLASYKPTVGWPARGSYRGYEIIAGGPPVAGATVVQSLQILENFDVASYPFLGAESTHLIAESTRLAYIDQRWLLGDPNHVYVPLQEMLDKEYAKERASEIDVNRMIPSRNIKPGNFTQELASTGTEGDHYESPSTTHISVIDKDRNMVSITQTISSFWGCRCSVPGTGIIMNNQVSNFSSDSARPSYMTPGKHVGGTVAPTLVLKEGKPFLSIGSPGAGRIVPTLVQILSHIIDRGMLLQEAIDAPRFYVRDNMNRFECESRFEPDVLTELQKRGWQFRDDGIKGEFDLYFGGAQGVMVDPETGKLVGAADPRRDGAAVGY